MFMIRKALIKTKKPNTLSKKDIETLDILILFEFDRVVAFNEIFKDDIEKLSTTKANKYCYFDKIFKRCGDEAYKYLDLEINKRYRGLFMTRETLILRMMEDIKMARRDGQFGPVATMYGLIAKMSGYLIDRHFVEVSKAVEIQYILPEQLETKENNVITIDIFPSDTQTT
jgi:hypothetical protein